MRRDGRAPTLTDRAGLGGIVAQDGFDYQLFDGLVRLPKWLGNPVFEQMMFEGLEDLEVRFFSPYAPQLHVLDRFQAKSADLQPNQVRDVFENFRAFENAYPKTARIQTLVTPRLPPTLGWLRRNPARVRNARPFYSPFPNIVSESDESLKSQCIGAFGESLGTFVSDFVEVCERSFLSREAAVQGFAGELQRTFPTLEFQPGKVAAAFDALGTLVRGNLGVPLRHSDLTEELAEHLEQELPLPSVFPVHIRSDQSEPNPAALQIDASRFCGGSVPFPACNVWASGLIAPLARTASWLRGRHVSRVALAGAYRLTTAMVVGWTLRSACGFELNVPTREGFWRTDDRPRPGEAPDWQMDEPERLRDGQLAVSIGVLRDPSADLSDTAGVAPCSVLGFHLPTALACAAEAQASIAILKRGIDKAVARLQPHGIQLYVACPAAFAVALGHRWNAMPPTQLHEYVPEERCYVKTAVLSA